MTRKFCIYKKYKLQKRKDKKKRIKNYRIVKVFTIEHSYSEDRVL